MNEKIKLLAKRAGFIDRGSNITAYMDFDHEKFAELIVRECADFANDHNSEVEGVTLGVGRALKQHFGVAE